MKRITEQELMLDSEQVLAYANADFEDPHSGFITMFKEFIDNELISGNVLDAGCGPGDTTFRFAKEFPKTYIDAVDGSQTMISYATKLLDQKKDIKKRIRFIHSMIDAFVPDREYSFILSNSLLHHLHDPDLFWYTVKRCSTENTRIFIMDLRRPHGFEAAMNLVKKYAGEEPDILKKDFFNSLIAAFEPAEIREQCRKCGLDRLSVSEQGDRHVVICG